uniref:IgGFc-binding protein N-terminal domain-containing protein n=1 Tax=Plectus sambesii TaxID=2011161 RepID=A0A914VGF3_9BILA
MATFALPSTAIDDSPTEMGFNPIAPATVYISATQPVSIIASSIAADGSTGDRYLVLPTTLLQKNYVVAGRSLINGQQSSSVHMVYIIVTQDGTEISTSILGLNGVSTRPMNAGEMLKYTADDHYTIAINSSKPVALVAGTTCFAYADGRCDHQAYMPLPVPDTCSNPGDQLYLLADINGNNNNYFVGSTYDCNIQYDYDSMSPSGGGSGRLNPIEPVQLFNSSISPEQNPQSTHTITTSTNPLQITRLGQNPTPQGVYLVTVPSVTQYVTGTVFFTAFGRTNSIQVIGDTAAQQSALLNGQAAALGFWQPYSNVDGYSITHVPVDPGQLHNFTASGKFVITVYGQGGGMSYAYLPAVNAPSYVSSSSTSSTTSTTTTTSVPSSTPTVTTTFSSSSTSAPSPPTATEGVEFWTMFIPNKGGYCNTNASMTFFNKNQQGVTVNITYNNNTMTSPVIMTTVQIFVQAASMYTFPFPTTSLEPTDNVPLFNEAPGATVYITSTLPISIVASSYSLDGSSGDRFLVLPTTLLQNNYVVAGKNQANLGIPGSTQVAYIIVTQNDTNVTATLLGKDASANQARSDFGLSSGTIIKFVSINQYTVVVSSSKPVAMVVGSNCFMFTNGICDHQAHMPLPVPSSCTFPGNDRHLLNNFNSSTNNYFIASTFNCDIPFDYDTNLESGGGTGRLTPNQPVMMTDFTLPGQNNADTHIVNSDTNPLLITQMGNSKTGTYLVYVPAIEQFVSGTVLFAAFDSTVQMQVIADKTTENGGALLDGKGFPGSWIQFPGADGYFITNVPLTQGLHSFSSNGKFLITIYGSTQTSEYAYLPAMSAPLFLHFNYNFHFCLFFNFNYYFNYYHYYNYFTFYSYFYSYFYFYFYFNIHFNFNSYVFFYINIHFYFNLNFYVNVNVTYNNLTFQSKLTDFVTVPGMSTVTRYFPQDSLDTTVYSEPADDGFNFVPESSFRIQSNAPISVFATSTSLDGSSGDTYLVLPTTMLQTTYVVAGADQVNLSNYGSRHVVYFIATQDSTEFHVTMMRNGAVSQGFEEFDAGGMCSFITAGAYTVIVTTTKPIAVVVGTDCFSYAEGACDHQAYMPQPLPVDCYTTDGSFFDSHPVPNQLPRTNKYFVASIYGCNTTYDYTTGTCPINCGSGLLTSGQPVGFTDFSLPSNQSFYVTSASNPLLVTRQGKNALHGAYLLDVPSMSQFVTGSVQFFAFGSNCSLQVVAFLSNGQALLDGQPFGANWTLFSDSMNVQIGIATFPITPGQHTFSMDGGSFFIEVYGSFSGISSYAYLPAINAPNYGNE